MIDRHSVNILTAHWSVFCSFLFNVVDYFGGFRLQFPQEILVTDINTEKSNDKSYY